MNQAEHREAIENAIRISQDFHIEIKVVPKNDNPHTLQSAEIINRNLKAILQHRDILFEQGRNYYFAPVLEQAIASDNEQIEKLIGI